MASLVKRNQNFYAQFHDASRSPKRKRISLRTGTRSIAKRLLVRLEDAYALDEFDPWTQDFDNFFNRSTEPTTLSEALDEFLADKERLGRSENTINSYRWIVGQWSRNVGSDTSLVRVKPADIEPFVRDASVSKSTRHTRYRNVRPFLRWCAKEGYIDTPPTEPVEGPDKPHKLPKRLTKDDLDSICSALLSDYREKLDAGQCAPGQLRWYVPLFRFAFYTGMRISEIARLRWQDIDRDRRLILIRKQKNKRQQTIPLNRQARRILDDVRDGADDEFVFRSPSYEKTSRSTRRFCERVSKVFREARRDAGLPDSITLHSLRHGFCTALAEAGKSAVVIKEAARHADIQTSMQYVHMANERLKNQLHDVFDST